MIDVRKLRMIAELERLGTIAAVAQELHLTPPAVSMQINSLERELGLSLTERRGRRLELTPAGRTLAAHGKDITDRLALVEFEADGLREGTVGHYRIAAFPSAARTIVTDIWTSILGGDSSVTFDLVTSEPEDAVAALLAGVADLAVIHDYSIVPRHLPVGVESDRLGAEPVWLAIRADDPAAVAGIDLARLAERSWVVPDRSLTCFDMVDRACGLAGFRPDVVAETADFSVQLGLVQAGVGVALVPDMAVGTVPDGVVLLQPSHPIERHLFAATRTGQLTDPGLIKLRDSLSAAMATRSARRAVAP